MKKEKLVYRGMRKSQKHQDETKHQTNINRSIESKEASNQERHGTTPIKAQKLTKQRANVGTWYNKYKETDSEESKDQQESHEILLTKIST
jgi:hypothetical protein